MDVSAHEEHQQQLLALYSDLQEVENEIAQHSADRDRLREQISLLVSETDKPCIIPGVARMEITRPSVTISYDKAGVDAVARDMANQGGMIEWVQRLLKCQKESVRTGSLRITRLVKKEG